MDTTFVMAVKGNADSLYYFLIDYIPRCEGSLFVQNDVI